MSAAKFDTDSFREALDRSRVARKLQWKDISKATGVSASTLSRMSTGRAPDAASMAALSAWSGINPADYTAKPAPKKRFSGAALAVALREMVGAEFRKDGEAFTSNETIVREQFEMLDKLLAGRA